MLKSHLDGLFYVITITCSTALTAGSQEEKHLLQTFLSGIDTAARPVQHQWEVVNVTLRMWVLHVLKLEHIGEDLTLATKYRLRWNVPVMTWNPEDHGNVTSLHLQPNRIWTPDLVLLNTLMKEKKKDGYTRDSLLAATPVVITHEGKAEWRSPTITKAFCKMDVIYFPFDIQKCSMNFTLMSHTVKEVTLLPEGDHALTLEDGDTNNKHGIWEVEVEPVKMGEVYLGISSDPHPQLTMTLVLERKPDFYIYNVIYPVVIIMIVCLIGFCLPNSCGEKMVFGVSIMVAMNFFQQYLLKNSFPTGEGIPILGQLFGTGLAMAAIAVVCSVLTLRIHFKGSRDPGNLPDNAIVKHLSKVTFMQSYVEDLISTEPKLLSNRPLKEHSPSDGISSSSAGHGGLQNRNDNNYCRNRRRTVRSTNERTTLSGILSQVTDLKEIYKTQLEKEELIDKAKNSWELVAMMFQRIAAVVCVVFLAAVCTGIFLQLKYRTK